MKVYDTSLIINGIIFINLIYSIIKLFVNNLVAMCDQVKSNFNLIYVELKFKHLRILIEHENNF